MINLKVGVCTYETLDKLLTETVSPLRVTTAKFLMKLEGLSHNGSVESCPPIKLESESENDSDYIFASLV